MNSHFYHLQINIDFKNISFYKDLMTALGWSLIFEDEMVAGYKSGSTGDLWFVKTERPDNSDYDAKGVNHISIRVDQVSDVDQIKNHLEKIGTKMLFDTPRHRPEFATSEKDTYYQIMFESPDKVLFEVVYVGSI